MERVAEAYLCSFVVKKSGKLLVKPVKIRHIDSRSMVVNSLKESVDIPYIRLYLESKMGLTKQVKLEKFNSTVIVIPVSLTVPFSCFEVKKKNENTYFFARELDLNSDEVKYCVNKILQLVR